MNEFDKVLLQTLPASEGGSLAYLQDRIPHGGPLPSHVAVSKVLYGQTKALRVGRVIGALTNMSSGTASGAYNPFTDTILMAGSEEQVNNPYSEQAVTLEHERTHADQYAREGGLVGRTLRQAKEAYEYVTEGHDNTTLEREAIAAGERYRERVINPYINSAMKFQSDNGAQEYIWDEREGKWREP